MRNDDTAEAQARGQDLRSERRRTSSLVTSQQASLGPRLDSGSSLADLLQAPASIIGLTTVSFICRLPFLNSLKSSSGRELKLRLGFGKQSREG